MKEVLISIQPRWCKLIANGKKTVEVRKTKPKLETPFKAYIYCTKGDPIFTQSAFCDEVSNAVFEKHCELVKDGKQVESLDEEMRKIFKRSGYPDEFFKSMIENWNIDTNRKGG